MKPLVVILRTESTEPNKDELKKLSKFVEEGYQIVGQSSLHFGGYDQQIVYTLARERSKK